jgi:CubicO group peptidase (beta-lactamase class C family)
MRKAPIWRVAVFVAVALALGLSQPTVAEPAPQPMASTTPVRVNMSAARLDRLTQTFDARVKAGEAAGYVWLVARHGQLVTQQSVGVQTLGSAEPMRTDTLFRIASMTKPVTAVAALTLIEQGKLSLADPVKRYLPEVGAMRVQEPAGTLVQPKRDITIRDLLIHTSGIGYRFDTTTPLGKAYVAAAPYETGTSLADAVSRIAAQPLYFHPGERILYSYGFDVLGRVIEVITGEPFERYVARTIFTPLGMRDTRFSLEANARNRLATAYQKQEDGSLKPMPGTLFGDPFNPAVWPSGGAGLISTAPDYLRFAQMLLNGGVLGGVRILSPASVALMTSDHLPTTLKPRLTGTPLEGQRFGLGVAVVDQLGRSAGLAGEGDYGWGGHYDTQFFISPAYDVVAVLFSQRQPRPGEEDLNTLRLFKSLVLGAVEK